MSTRELTDRRAAREAEGWIIEPVCCGPGYSAYRRGHEEDGMAWGETVEKLLDDIDTRIELEAA